MVKITLSSVWPRNFSHNTFRDEAYQSEDFQSREKLQENCDLGQVREGKSVLLKQALPSHLHYLGDSSAANHIDLEIGLMALLREGNDPDRITMTPAEINHPKYGPSSEPRALPLSQDHAYSSRVTSANPNFWPLMGGFFPQENGFSCSMASLATVFNAILAIEGRKQRAFAANLNQTMFCDLLGESWLANRVLPQGDRGMHGLSLDELAFAADLALKKLDLPEYQVAAVEFNDMHEGLQRRFSEDLLHCHQNRGSFVICHFHQDYLTGLPGAEFPHISPVGAFNQEDSRLLVMETDRVWYEPYWVSSAEMSAAMSRHSECYGYGGYLSIKKR